MYLCLDLIYLLLWEWSGGSLLRRESAQLVEDAFISVREGEFKYKKSAEMTTRKSVKLAEI